MNYKEPEESQLKLMREYSEICSQAITMMMKCDMKCESSPSLNHASARLQESMAHFNTYVMNGGKLSQEN